MKELNQGDEVLCGGFECVASLKLRLLIGPQSEPPAVRAPLPCSEGAPHVPLMRGDDAPSAPQPPGDSAGVSPRTSPHTVRWRWRSWVTQASRSVISIFILARWMEAVSPPGPPPRPGPARPVARGPRPPCAVVSRPAPIRPARPCGPHGGRRGGARRRIRLGRLPGPRPSSESAGWR